VAKPKTRPYTVKKVDQKVILTTPQHGKNRSKSTGACQIFFKKNSLFFGKEALLFLKRSASYPPKIASFLKKKKHRSCCFFVFASFSLLFTQIQILSMENSALRQSGRGPQTNWTCT
jgi:hypothetical protein